MLLSLQLTYVNVYKIKDFPIQYMYDYILVCHRSRRVLTLQVWQTSTPVGLPGVTREDLQRNGW